MRLKQAILGMIILMPEAQAKNLGTIGHTFVIQEQSLLQVIQERLQQLEQSGKITIHNQELQQKAKQHIENPTPVSGLTTTRHYQTHHYDPSFILDGDLKDHQGQIFARKGKRYNPLDVMSFGEPMLFIDGRDEAQVQWALQQQGQKILIAGSPIQLEKAHGQAFFFDQGGVLVKKLSIQAVPARVSQQDKMLLIESFPLIQEVK